MPHANKLRLSAIVAEDSWVMVPVLFKGKWASAITEAAAMGYPAVEIQVHDIWAFDANSVRSLCKKAHMEVSALGTGQMFSKLSLSLASNDQVIRTKAIEGMKLCVDAAAKLTCGVAIGRMRGKTGADAAGNVARRADGFREIGAYAAQKKVPIYIPALNRYEIDNLNTADEIMRFIDEYQLPNTFVQLDTFHMNIEERNSADTIRRCGKRLGSIHVAENTRYYPGHDLLDFDAIFQALRDIDYTGYVTVQCLPLPTPAEAAKLAREFLTEKFLS